MRARCPEGPPLQPEDGESVCALDTPVHPLSRQTSSRGHGVPPRLPRFSTISSRLIAFRRVSASTQNQALSALLFLYRHVLEVELP